MSIVAVWVQLLRERNSSVNQIEIAASLQKWVLANLGAICTKKGNRLKSPSIHSIGKSDNAIENSINISDLQALEDAYVLGDVEV